MKNLYITSIIAFVFILSSSKLFAQASVQTDASDSVLIYTGGTKTVTVSPSGQMRIGNTGPINANAMLQLNSSTQGLLLPRLTGAIISGMTSVPAGMIVYNTTTNKFTVFNGTSWNDLLTSGAAGWGLTGNASTVDGTNFIGTTDDVPLTIRVNNQRSGYISSNTGTTAAFGYSALRVNTANYNAAFGHNSMGNTTTGGANTAVGFNSLASNVSGSSNTAVGFQSLLNNTSSDNTAVGYMSLGNSTSGSQNTALGLGASYNNTIGSENVVIGSWAQYSNVAGSKSVAIGHLAMYNANNQVGAFNSSNVAIGYEALKGSGAPAANTGNENTTVGYQSMLSNTSGSVNTALGNYALGANTTGGYNTASGYAAMMTNTTGDRNTAYGFSSLNTNTTGTNNTAFGYGADVTSTSLTNANAFGYNAKVASNNSLVLGGTGADVVNVGIGTTSPSALLDVTGDGGTIIVPRKSTAGDPTGINGMIYYNTNMSKFRVYQNNTWADWVSTASGWGLTGNASTVDGTNFIGTTDNVALNFRVNGQKAGRIEGSSGNNLFLGYLSGNAITSGSGVTAVGQEALKMNSTGYQNTAFGYQTLINSTTGNQNTAIGTFAGESNTTGSNNTALGRVALGYNTTGSDNTAIGHFALNSNVAGGRATAIGAGSMQNANDQVGAFTNSNVAVGYEALRGSATPASNTGNYNTVIGYQTMIANTSGSYNTASGYTALNANTTGTYNAAFGYQSLTANTSGVSNSAFGNSSLLSNTSGNSNTAAGNSSLRMNSTGYSNTASGHSSLFSNTTGYTNTVSGYQTMYNNTVGNNNTSFGSQSLNSNVAGSNATAIGYGAMQYANNTATAFTNTNVAVGFEALRGSATPSSNTGNDNTATGYQSLYINSSGNLNSGYGYYTLNANTTGAGNAAFGAGALRKNTTGNYNSASGYESLRENLTGANNTASGYGSLYYTTGSNNTAMGYFAGNNNISGTSNTLIGSSADVVTDALIKATAIGYNAKVASSNALVLGGTGADAVNVGINTTSPTQKLEVVDGNVLLSATTATAPELRLEENTTTGGNHYTAFKAADQAANITYTLPSTITASNYLTTDASGNLSWGSVSGLSGGTSDYLARWTGTNSLGLSAFQDNGAEVGLGIGANANYKLNIGSSNAAIALQVIQSGTNTGAFFYNSNAANAGSTVYARNDGTGVAGDFQIVNALSSANAISSSTNGGGNAMDAYTGGTGNAGHFQISNVINSNNAINATSNGSGATGLFANTGTGPAIHVSSGSVGIGDGTPASLFTVGSGDKFQVDANGNIVRLNNVATSFPAANTSGVLSNNGSGTLTWASNITIAPIQTASNGLTTSANDVKLGGALTAATSITSASNTNVMSISNSALTNGTALTVSSNATTGTGVSSSSVMQVTRTGANTNASHTAYGMRSEVANTGATSTNIAAYLRASGGTTNYALIVPASGGNVGIGTGAPSASSLLHVVGAGNGSTVNLEDNSITNGSLLYMSSTATTGTGSSQSKMISINRSGANANASHTAKGISSTITNTGTTSTNIAAEFSASGATNNYALIVPAAGGIVGIGTSTPNTNALMSISKDGFAYVNMEAHGAVSTNIPEFALTRSRGTETAKTIVSSGDVLGKISFSGYDGTNFYPAASITGTADAATGATDMPGLLQFNTSPDGTVVPAERMRIINSGYVGINKTAPTSYLHMGGSVAYPVRTTAGATTLGTTDYFLVITGGAPALITLPAANTCTGRVYIVKCIPISNWTISSYVPKNGTGTSTVVTASSTLTIISDGTSWQEL